MVSVIARAEKRYSRGGRSYLDVLLVHRDGGPRLFVARVERQLLDNALEDGVQPPRADVLDRLVRQRRHARDLTFRLLGELELDLLSRKQLCLLAKNIGCLLYTSPSPRDQRGSRMPSSA